MAAVFMAGPIAGLLVQPVIGVMSDQSTHRLGRRRPFLLAAALICALFVLLLGFARIPAALFGIEGATPVLTVLGIWGLDFAVNAVMAVDRSLILDMLPAEQQAAGNAWVARICAIGSILGFYVGDLDLPNTFPFSWLGFIITSGCKAPSEPQVRCLSLLTAFFMVSTHLLVIWAAVERRLESTGDSQRTQFSVRKPSQILVKSFREFAKIARQLSQPIRAVFKVQIFSWICWFPLMFYSTEWVSQTAVASYLKDAKENSPASTIDYEALRARGTRAGSHAMFLQALLSFATSILLPLVLPPSEQDATNAAEHKIVGARSTSSHDPTLSQPHHDLWLAPNWLPAFAQDLLEGIYARIATAKSAKGRGQFKGIKLTTIWIVSHFFLALTTWFTLPVYSSQSLSGATFLMTLIGFCWAITNWVPYALLGIFIQTDAHEGSTSRRHSGAYESIPMQDDVDPTSADPRTAEDAEEGDELFFDPSASPAPSSPKPATAVQAGSILGLHNVFIVIPQLIVSIAASILFALFEPKRQAAVAAATATEADSNVSQGDAVNVVFVIGGVFSFAAGLMTIRLSKKFDRGGTGASSVIHSRTPSVTEAQI